MYVHVGPCLPCYGRAQGATIAVKHAETLLFTQTPLAMLKNGTACGNLKRTAKNMSQNRLLLCTDRLYQVHTKESISAHSEHQRENNGKSVRRARYT